VIEAGARPTFFRPDSEIFLIALTAETIFGYNQQTFLPQK
jgi:hypothetical protein